MSEQRWKVTVDHGTCIGSAVCAGTLPDIFRIEDNRSVPVHELVEPNDDVLGAADACPMEAIRVVNTDTGDVLASKL